MNNFCWLCRDGEKKLLKTLYVGEQHNVKYWKFNLVNTIRTKKAESNNDDNMLRTKLSV